jgi:hypothetical protein
VKALIAAATAIARSHQHATARPEHVIAAIAADPEHWRKCLAPVSRHVLAKRAAEDVVALPASSAYRGGRSDPPLAPEPEALFAPSQWLRRPSSVALLVKRADPRRGARAAAHRRRGSTVTRAVRSGSPGPQNGVCGMRLHPEMIERSDA